MSLVSNCVFVVKFGAGMSELLFLVLAILTSEVYKTYYVEL